MTFRLDLVGRLVGWSHLTGRLCLDYRVSIEGMEENRFPATEYPFRTVTKNLMYLFATYSLGGVQVVSYQRINATICISPCWPSTSLFEKNMSLRQAHQLNEGK